MKYALLLIVVLFSRDGLAQRFGFTFFRNNGEAGVYLAVSDNGRTWREVNGGQPILVPAVGGKLTRDPSVCVGPDKRYHMVWTTSWKDNGFGIAHSDDLRQWSAQSFVPVNSDEPQALNTWAPEIFYDAATQRYLVIWATTITGTFPETAHQGDEKYNHRIYCTTTKDFVTWTPKQLFFNDGYNVIDAFLFKQGNRYGMVVKDETLKPKPAKNLRIVWSTGDVMGPWSKSEAPFTDNQSAWAEGPSVIRVDSTWLIYYDMYNKGGYGAVETGDFKTFSPVTVTLPKGIRHGTIFALAAPLAFK